jgi:FkbM family methyltransferase
LVGSRAGARTDLRRSRIEPTFRHSAIRKNLTRLARVIKRHGTNLLARHLILRFRPVEEGFLHISRAFPSARPVQWLCFSLSREAAKRADRTRVVRLGAGPLMQLDISDVYGQVYYFGKPYEPLITDLILRSLNPGETAIDVGANAGYHTLVMAQAVGPTGVVHAFEPAPQLVEMLKCSVQLNKFQDRVRINRVAVSRITDSNVPFLMSGGTNTGSSSLVDERAGASSLSEPPSIVTAVETVSMDEYARTASIQMCSLMKIDVEGAEHLVIEGAARMIERMRPRVIICETRIGESAHRLLTLLNYVVDGIVDEQPESKDGDRNLIANVIYMAVDGIPS